MVKYIFVAYGVRAIEKNAITTSRRGRYVIPSLNMSMSKKYVKIANSAAKHKLLTRRGRLRQRGEPDFLPSSAAPTRGMPTDEGIDDNQFVGAVARALSVLNTFRPEEGPLGNAELAARTGLTKPTVSRLTYTLARCGYLSFIPRYRVYELGPSVLALGHIAMSTVNVRQVAWPLMRELAREANFNVGLGTRDQHLMVYIDACEGEGLVSLRLFAGSRIPIMTTAMGRAYLAGLSASEREALFAELKPRYGADWQGLVKAAEKAVAEVKDYGFCVSIGEWRKDINGVAAPIHTVGDGRVHAINLGGPAYLVPEKALRSKLGQRIAEVARKVEMTLSPRPNERSVAPHRV